MAISPVVQSIEELRQRWWTAQLGGNESIGAIATDMDDLSQSVRIILTTPKGTDPFRPNFACDFLPYLDQPIDRAGPKIIRESMQAILTWEPRLAVTNAEVVFESPETGQSLLRITWALRSNPNIVGLTEVAI